MALQNNTHTVKPGEVIGGCTIESFIAAGGTGNVYRATKTLMERTVAVKILRPDFVTREDTLRRFLREARLASRLEHPSIVRVFDVGEDSGRYYIVMEYVEGRDLSAIVKKEGPLPVGDALRIARQVADGLAYAHEFGVVHRDIKPGNILVTEGGDAKIADFGLARPKSEDSEVTLSGQLIGTPAFMSPEQCRGLGTDTRSDLYSLGATLYTILSGKRPFDDEATVTVIHQVVNENPRSLQGLVPELPEKVVALVQRLMAKHPGARYQTAREVLAAIDEVLVRRFVFAREVVAPPSAPLLPPISWGRIAVLIVVGVVLGIGVHFLWPHMAASDSSDKEAAAGSPATGSERTTPRHSRITRRHVPFAKLRRGRTPDEDSAGTVRLPSRRAATDPARNEAARELLQYLASGYLDDALEYLESSARMDRRFHYGMTHVADTVKSEKLLPGSVLMRQDGPDSASGVLTFRYPKSNRRLALPVEWILQDGRWYVTGFLDISLDE